MLRNLLQTQLQGKKSNIAGLAPIFAPIFAKEVYILIGRESGATITELSELVGLDPSNTGRRCDAASQRARIDSQFAYAKKLVEEKYRAKIAESHV